MNGTYVMSTIRLSDGPDWFVYGLYDSFHRDPFYVGMSKNVVARGAQHRLDKGPVGARIKEIVAAGGHVDLRIISVCPTEAEAANRERIAIRAYPELINRVHYRPDRRPPPQAPGEHLRGEKHPKSKLTEKQVYEIKARLRRPAYLANRPRAMAREFGVSESTMRNIKIGRAWGWVSPDPAILTEARGGK